MRITLKISFLLFFLTSYLTCAQGDGPESHFLKPQKMWGLNIKYLNLNQNMSVNGDLLMKASLFLTQFKNQLILDYEKKQIYRGTDSIYATTVRFRNEGHRHL